MRVFIVLALIALARADVGGYNYEANNVGSSNLGGSYGGGSNLGGGFGGSSNLGGSHDAGVQHQAAPVEVEKEFYTFSAPEGEFEDSQPLQDLASSVKRNLQVIFIRGPENNGVANAALNLAKSATESKTAIYVLTKQNDASELAQKLANQHNHQASKPEVHFVKYRTQEDAHNAQHAIQSQYDQLGGSSQSHDGGVASVLDYASKAAAPAPANTYIPPQVPSNQYLPNLKKF